MACSMGKRHSSAKALFHCWFCRSVWPAPTWYRLMRDAQAANAAAADDEKLDSWKVLAQVGAAAAAAAASRRQAKVAVAVAQVSHS